MAVTVTSYTNVDSGWFSGTFTRAVSGVAWSTGDIVVIIGGREDANPANTLGNPTNANLTIGAAKASDLSGGTAECGVYVWASDPAVSAQTGQSISATATGTGKQWGMCAVVFSGNPTGIANAVANLTESGFSRTVAAGSGGVYALMDFNATNPPAKTPSAGTGTATERLDQGNSTNYGQYIYTIENMSAGTFTFAPSNYTSLQVAQVFIEVLAPATVVGGSRQPPFAPGHPTQSFQFSRQFGVDAVSSADLTVSANVSVGAVAASGGATAAPSAATTTLVGVATRSTVTPEPSALTTVKAGVVTVSTVTPQPSASSTANSVGVATRSTVTPEVSATSTALVGVVLEGLPSTANDLSVDCSVKVGVATRSTVTPEPSAAATAKVGVATRSTASVEASAVTTTLVGVAPRAGATVDISTTSRVQVGVATRAQPSADTDVTVTANVSVGVATRSTVTPAPSATAVAQIGVQARSTGNTITVTSTSTSRVGILTASTPTAVWAASSKLFVGVQTSTSLTPIAIIVVDRIDIWTEPAAPSYTEPSLAWIEPAADSYTEPSTGWVEPPPVEGVSV